MIRHVFMLIWNRKRANALIMLELVVTFLILFALVGFTLNLSRLYNKPLGFNVANTWAVTMSGAGLFDADDTAAFRDVMAVAQQMEEVKQVEMMFDLPFDIGGSSMFISVGNLVQEDVDVHIVTSGLPQAIGIQLVEGRWFGPEDETQGADEETTTPVLVNRTLAEAAGGKVLGELIDRGPGSRMRIVGVYDQFRHHGQFSAITPAIIQRLRTDGTFFEGPQIILLLKPGVPADFEERLMATLQRAAPGWDFDVNTWEELQDTHFTLYMIPLMIVSLVVLFLLAMVGFGLLGVLWQNVIRRTPEMGVRRAMGATAGAVRLQVVLELLAVALFSLAIGIAIVVQFPLSGILQSLDWNLFVPSAVVSSMLLLGLCILFALYPSYQATRQDPVEALRYE